MSKRTELLSDLARQALAQYDADVKAGGEPIYPLWAKELQAVLKSHELMVAALQNCIAFIQDAHIVEAQWTWEPVETAHAALATAEAA